MSVLDVTAKALEELRNKPLHSHKEVKLVSQPSKLVKDKVVVGPFYGFLPQAEGGEGAVPLAGEVPHLPCC